MRTCSVFLFLCQFAENDGFQVHPCTYKVHDLIGFDGCIIFHGVYVPHFPCPVYHRWAFGLVPGLCYCEQCCNEHSCACVLIVERFIVLGYIPSNGIAGSNGISISKALRNRHTVFHNGWTNLHSYQQCKSIPISPHPLQHLLFPDILVIAILSEVAYLNVVLICISLITSDDEHFFVFVGCINVFF